MLQSIKRSLPKPLKKVLINIKQKTYGDWQKRRLYKRMQSKHAELLTELKRKDRVKVVFLAIHKSIWKVDSVFKKMLSDPFFEPLILVCPYTISGEKRMRQDLLDTYKYFEEKGYPVISSYSENDGRWISLEEFKPDIVFFTNPHKLTFEEYYEKAYLNYLTCYVPYYSDVASSYNEQHAYNQKLHNSLWIQFVGNSFSLDKASKYLANGGENLILTGSPFLEELLTEPSEKNIAWEKAKFFKKKIIYAPHQSIFESEELHLSTFIEVGELMMELAEKYKEKTHWSFKPHPLLKSKLYKHPSWGKIKTDKYYEYWEHSQNCQLDEGDYVKLFQGSDALIHDCGSFIFDYLLINKPCAYLLLNPQRQLEAINGFGREALNCYTKINSLNKVESFIQEIIAGSSNNSSQCNEFKDKNIYRLYQAEKPSDLLIDVLKSRISN